VIPRPEPTTLFCQHCESDQPHTLLAGTRGATAMCRECATIRTSANAVPETEPK
jgi:hypothetical protein